ncbi:hypothetical protein JVT61DRAFT_3524 [Boletus reticuloceps]|uniref:Cytochrome P450 n=1 Tax=Boletus reticuloceps TaxID=495285 RepID=A0A8I2YNK7_9AGAM|nr:hypothetical protein JVT61DRAFT_3524 [Boletus reticuloceps]
MWYALDAGIVGVGIWTLLQWLYTTRRKSHTTQLRGPPSESFLYGVGKRILSAEDSGAIYEAWAQEYGPVYAAPSTPLGSKKIILCDPKAIAHAKVFRPGRWLEDGKGGIPAKAKELQGHRHLLTFMDGPRVCLGKNFVVTELKVVLVVLVKNFVFELRDAVDSKIEIGRGLLPRPKLAGEVGCKLPLRVRPLLGEIANDQGGVVSCSVEFSMYIFSRETTF